MRPPHLASPPAFAHKLAPQVKEVEQSARIKDLEVSELKKIRKDIVRRTRDYEKLYDLVKNQRNKFVNLIQSANQSTTEMKDKSKILNNELEILHSEVHSKDKLLGQSRSQHSSAVSERDQLRIELGRLGTTFRGKQDVVDEQIAEVDKLNAIISQMEKAMLRLRKQYEVRRPEARGGGRKRRGGIVFANGQGGGGRIGLPKAWGVLDVYVHTCSTFPPPVHLRGRDQAVQLPGAPGPQRAA
eukprot:9949-Chlamydomonas_euryale.AAC.1